MRNPAAAVRLHHRLRVPSVGEAWRSLPTVLLVHGLDSASDTFDGGVLDDLSQTYRTVAVDLRAHGRSPFGDGDFGLKSQLTDLQQMLDDLQVDDAVLLGHSQGARVCIPLALQLGAKCLGLVIEDMDLRPRKPRDELSEEMRQRMEGFRGRYPDEESMYGEMEGVGYDRERVKAWVEGGGRIWREGHEYVVGIHPLASHREVNALLATSEARDCFPRLRKDIDRRPVLVIQAEETQSCTDEGVAEMRRLLPELEVARIAGSNHSIHSSRPVEFMAVLRAFLAKCSSSSGRAASEQHHPQAAGL